MQILIIALQSDLHADSVVYQLLKRGVDVVRVDPTLDVEIPEKISISSAFGLKARYTFKNKKAINPLDCSGIFCRFAIDSLIPTEEEPLLNFSASETLYAFLAPLRMVESSRWINDPWIENRSDCKILQLKIAKDIGLAIPEFLVSSDYSDLISFYNEYKNIIIKPITDTTLALVNGTFVKHEHLITDKFYAPYTADFTPINSRGKENPDNTPALLQRKIDKKSDIRVTVIDNNAFAAEIPYKDGNPVDFRLNKFDGLREYHLPPEIKHKLIELVKALGLRFASCDLVLDKTGQMYFLESNVQGNWLWTESPASYNISECIANALLNGK